MQNAPGAVKAEWSRPDPHRREFPELHFRHAFPTIPIAFVAVWVLWSAVERRQKGHSAAPQPLRSALQKIISFLSLVCVGRLLPTSGRNGDKPRTEAALSSSEVDHDRDANASEEAEAAEGSRKKRVDAANQCGAHTSAAPAPTDDRPLLRLPPRRRQWSASESYCHYRFVLSVAVLAWVGLLHLLLGSLDADSSVGEGGGGGRRCSQRLCMAPLNVMAGFLLFGLSVLWRRAWREVSGNGRGGTRKLKRAAREDCRACSVAGDATKHTNNGSQQTACTAWLEATAPGVIVIGGGAKRSSSGLRGDGSLQAGKEEGCNSACTCGIAVMNNPPRSHLVALAASDAGSLVLLLMSSLFSTVPSFAIIFATMPCYYYALRGAWTSRPIVLLRLRIAVGRGALQALVESALPDEESTSGPRGGAPLPSGHKAAIYECNCQCSRGVSACVCRARKRIDFFRSMTVAGLEAVTETSLQSSVGDGVIRSSVANSIDGRRLFSPALLLLTLMISAVPSLLGLLIALFNVVAPLAALSADASLWRHRPVVYGLLWGVFAVNGVGQGVFYIVFAAWPHVRWAIAALRSGGERGVDVAARAIGQMVVPLVARDRFAYVYM